MSGAGERASMRGLFRLGIAIAAIVFVVDQASKLYVHDLLVGEPTRLRSVFPFLNVVSVWNHGISFGMLGGGEEMVRWGLAAVGVVVIGGLLAWLARVVDPLVAAALGLAIGGAAGNVADRLRFGAVFDFIDVHLFGWHFWIFNLADAGISLGALALLVGGVFVPQRGAEPPMTRPAGG